MGLLNFLKFLGIDRIAKEEKSPTEFIPAFWEDDYCQKEIIPVENRSFILDQIKLIEESTKETKTDYGFTALFEREAMPIETISKEIRVGYLEKTLLSYQFKKANKIWYEQSKLLDCEKGKTKAFGLPSFTIFFDTEKEIVKNIWLHIELIVDGTQFAMIEAALYTLGEECGLAFIDWDSLQLFDLADKKQIQEYLMDYWK